MTRWLWAVAALTAAATVGAQAGSGSLDSLVKAERSFARASVATSQRDAFLANFADDGVWFTPGPENTKAALQKLSPPPGPPARTLDWEPAIGDVAASGDLGYTTGPYISAARAGDEPPHTGWFFSVWRWRSGAGWKVAADFGVEGPGSGPLRPRSFQRADVRSVKPKATPAPGRVVEELRAADAAFAAEAASRGLQSAYRTWATGDLLVFRQGVAPLGTRLAVVSAVSSVPRPFVLQPLHAEASGAGDLGFTYGAYSEEDVGGRVTRGFYLHVWKRLAGGWALAADVKNQ